MIPKYYRLSTIQKLSLELQLHSSYFNSLVSGESPSGLTPQEILDSFLELTSIYNRLAQSVTGISVAIGAGHDPDRQLFASDFSDYFDFQNLPSLDEFENVTNSSK